MFSRGRWIDCHGACGTIPFVYNYVMELQFPLRSVFIALPLENAPKWQFQALQEALKNYEDILSFQNPQSPHLTLSFWPMVLELEMDGIEMQAEKIAAAAHPFSLLPNNT